MNICKSVYTIKFMSGEEIPLIFSYLLDFDLKNFKVSFLLELRKKIRNTNFDQIKLFYNDDIYNLDHIPENNSIINIFIDENIPFIKDEEITYYKDTWKGDVYKSYLAWCQKSDGILKYICVYCSVRENIIMSFQFTEREFKQFIRRNIEDSEQWDFVDDKSYYRYVFETGLTSIN